MPWWYLSSWMVILRFIYYVLYSYCFFCEHVLLLIVSLCIYFHGTCCTMFFAVNNLIEFMAMGFSCNYRGLPVSSDPLSDGLCLET